jgi:DNA (cytosine-5)-methyltransferase 1
MPTEFAIVDLFAGPGGLAEGFSSIRNKDGSRPFQIALSVEKEASAFETLRFRSFFRQFNGRPPIDYYRFLNGEILEPDWGALFPVEWRHACLETVKLELGSQIAIFEINKRLKQITSSHGGNVILIGGASLSSLFACRTGPEQGHKGLRSQQGPSAFSVQGIHQNSAEVDACSLCDGKRKGATLVRSRWRTRI